MQLNSTKQSNAHAKWMVLCIIVVAAYYLLAMFTRDAYTRPVPPPPTAADAPLRITGTYVRKDVFSKVLRVHNYVRDAIGEHSFRCGSRADLPCLPRSYARKQITVYLSPQDPTFALSITDAITGKTLRSLDEQSAFLLRARSQEDATKKLFWRVTAILFATGIFAPFVTFAFFLLRRKN